MKPNIGQGDKGKTQIFGAPQKVWKDDPQVEAYGTADSLNSLIGHIRSQNRHAQFDPLLERIQRDLFVVQSLLAAHHGYSAMPELTQDNINFLEEKLQGVEADLPEIRNFILPSGTETATLLHRARTLARDLERAIVSFYRSKNYLSEGEPRIPEYLTYALPYANRLSDVFFALARWINRDENKKETLWKGT
jgi:cob(I)alamin adenosyltransferase